MGVVGREAKPLLYPYHSHGVSSEGLRSMIAGRRYIGASALLTASFHLSFLPPAAQEMVGAFALLVGGMTALAFLRETAAYYTPLSFDPPLRPASPSLPKPYEKWQVRGVKVGIAPPHYEGMVDVMLSRKALYRLPLSVGYVEGKPTILILTVQSVDRKRDSQLFSKVRPLLKAWAEEYALLGLHPEDNMWSRGKGTLWHGVFREHFDSSRVVRLRLFHKLYLPLPEGDDGWFSERAVEVRASPLR